MNALSPGESENEHGTYCCKEPVLQYRKQSETVGAIPDDEPVKRREGAVRDVLVHDCKRNAIKPLLAAQDEKHQVATSTSEASTASVGGVMYIAEMKAQDEDADWRGLLRERK